AAERSQVEAMNSRSNGGSLRIRTASKRRSGPSAGSCARYQSSSLSARCRRRVTAPTLPPTQYRLDCSQAWTSWPRACAARIIATLVSLYALSESSGSRTNRSRKARPLLLRRGRLLGGLLQLLPGLVRHVHDGA